MDIFRSLRLKKKKTPFSSFFLKNSIFRPLNTKRVLRVVPKKDPLLRVFCSGMCTPISECPHQTRKEVYLLLLLDFLVLVLCELTDYGWALKDYFWKDLQTDAENYMYNDLTFHLWVNCRPSNGPYRTIAILGHSCTVPINKVSAQYIASWT